MGRESIVLIRVDDRHLRTEDGRFLVERLGRCWNVVETSDARVFASPGYPRASSARREDLDGIRMVIFLVLSEEAERRRRAVLTQAADVPPAVLPPGQRRQRTARPVVNRRLCLESPARSGVLTG
jgi:hypothetical protein